MKILISNLSNSPIYEQIKEQIKTEIITGEVKENQLLPSVRQLARDLKISVITTMRAYNDLEQEGFIVNVQGKGCYVLPQNANLIRETMLKDIEAGLFAAVTAAKIAKIPKKEFIEIVELLLNEHY